MLSGEHVSVIATCFACAQAEAQLLAEAMQLHHFSHKSAIARAGDASTRLFLILEGMASADLFSVEGQYAQLAGYGPGELFGAYPEPTIYRADIFAVGALTLLSIDTTAMENLARAHATIAQGLARMMARQLDMVLDRMAARIGLSASGRFHRALLLLADGDGWIRPAPVLSALAIGVNTPRETASRALTALVRRGIVERHDDGLRVVSRRLLEDMVV